jgi:tRNA (guanine-N(7)-)-methyltransferase
MIVDPKKYPKPRTRHHNASNLYFPASVMKQIPRYYPPVYGTIEWAGLYENGNAPSILDIGCGWGSFLLHYATEHKDHNILGLEVRKMLTEWIMQVVKGENINNAAVLWYSLANKLGFIADNSIQHIFSFFPDPWIKKKHQKRRAFTPELLQELMRTSQKDAVLWQMTDVPDVAAYHFQVLEQFPIFQLDSFQFIGEWTEDWQAVFPEGLHMLKPAQQECNWNIPMTDQEIFSTKKNISYLRSKYLVKK